MLLLFFGSYLILWAAYLFSERYWVAFSLKRVSPEDTQGWTYRLNMHLRKKLRVYGNSFVRDTVTGEDGWHGNSISSGM